MKNICVLASALVLLGANSLSADHHGSSASFVGDWLATGDLPDGGVSNSTLSIKTKEGKLVGTSTSEDGEVTPLDRIKVDEKKLTVEVDVEQDGQSGIIGASASLNDKGELRGTWYLKGSDGTEYGSADWKAVRSLKSLLAGTWNGLGKSEDGDNEHEAVFKKSGSTFKGHFSMSEGEFDLEELKITKNQLSFKFSMFEGTVRIKASAQSAKKLVGEWTYSDSSDTEQASGEWSAVKE